MVRDGVHVACICVVLQVLARWSNAQAALSQRDWMPYANKWLREQPPPPPWPASSCSRFSF